MMDRASPQLEDGHTRIANELLEAIVKYPFNGAQYKIVFTIIRKTYGWKRKESLVSYGLLASLTRLNKRYIKKVVKILIQDKVLLKMDLKGKNILGLNKDYKQWRLWITQNSGIQKDTLKVTN